jgi:hypothetical protein
MTTPKGVPWQHLINLKDKHVVYPNFPENLWDNNYDELADQLNNPVPKNLPHPQDEPWAAYLHSFFTSPWLEKDFRLRENEELHQCARRILDHDKFVVPVTLTLSRQHRQGAVKRIALTTLSTHLFAATLEGFDESFNEKYNEEIEKVDKNKKLADQLSSENRRLKDEIVILQKKLSDCEKREAHADELVAANQALIFEWENLGLILKPGDTSKPPSFSVPATPQESHEILLKILAYANEKRQGDIHRQHGMPPPVPPPGGRPARLSLNFPPDASDIATLWARTPTALKQGFDIPQNQEDFLNFLLQRVFPAQPIDLSTCQHPRELALELGDPTGTQEWPTSLGQVRDLLNTPAPTNQGRSRLFKITEVPRFTDTAKYEEFRTSLKSFFESEEEPDIGEYGRAMKRVLTSFESPVARQAAAGWNVNTLIRLTWEQTWRAFLSALDKKFQAATIHEDTIKEYMSVRPKEAESAADFFNRFDAVVNKLREVQIRSGVPAEARFNEPTVVARLLQILPRYLVDNVRLDLSRRGRILETQSVEELRPEFERAWAYVPVPYKAPKTNPPGARQRAAPADQASTTNQVTQRRCGLVVSYDSAPAVPAELRGGLYPSPRNTPEQNAQNALRRRAAATRAVCEYCRRPRAEHHASGPNFKQVTAADPPRTRSTPAAIERPRVEDVTDQFLLPPPENPAA